MKQVIGWLSTEGKFYECLPYKHYDKATKIVEKLGINTGSLGTVTALERLGWLHLQEEGFCFINNDQNDLRRCTQAQINTLADIIIGTEDEQLYLDRIKACSAFS